MACLRVVSNEIDEFEQVIKLDTFWLPFVKSLSLVVVAVVVAAGQKSRNTITQINIRR